MNNEQTPAIEFRNVSISFDGVQALRNVSFTLPPGEMICVTGDSDSGKSVLLRLALGFLRPDEGRIFINGRETTVMEEDDLLTLRRETMGMVFQDNSLSFCLNNFQRRHSFFSQRRGHRIQELLGRVRLRKKGLHAELRDVRYLIFVL